MKTKELYEKDDKTLRNLLADNKAKLVKDRFKIASREMTMVSEVKKTKKLIAQISTILRQREIIEVENEAKKKAAK